jgi:DNA-binding NtrC family response regulator
MDGKRLLIIEMDRILREAVSRLFVLRGWQVERAATVIEGLDMLAPPPDCILMDVRSSDCAVEELIEKAHVNDWRSRVVLFTGVDPTDIHDGVDGRLIDAVVQKPAEAEALFQACEA